MTETDARSSPYDRPSIIVVVGGGRGTSSSKKAIAMSKSSSLRITSPWSLRLLLGILSLATGNSNVAAAAEVGRRGSFVRRSTQEVLAPEDQNDIDPHAMTTMTMMLDDNNSDGGDSDGMDPSSVANNVFEWHMKNHTSRFHIGCEKLLKENHDPEPLAPINFGGGMTMSADGGEGGGGTNEEGAEPSMQSSTSSSAAASAGQPINCINNFADTGTGTKYACSNINLMSFLNLATFKSPNKCNGATPSGSDVWGWIYNGREFALMGLSNGAGFVEVTDPLNPVYIGILLSHTGCSIWRNIKVYNNHAFVVSEASSHGMQVFDLTQLLTADPTKTPIEFPETAHYNGFGNSHTMDIDVVAGFAYAMGTNTYNGGLHIVNIQNPTSPTLAGGFSKDGYTHDGQCMTYKGPDTRYTNSHICFCYNTDSLTIVDVTNKSNPTQLSRLTYANSGYTHQGWLTDDGKHVIVNDETDQQTNTRTHVFKVESLTNPVYAGYHLGTTLAADHNLYIKGNLVFESNYRAGLQVLRIDNLNLSPPKLTQVGHFDIYTSNNNAGYNGSWSNYPYLPSGTVLVSGIEQGLYILRSTNNFGDNSSSAPTTFTPAPSPAPTTKSPTLKPTTKSPTRKPTKKPVTRRPTRQPTLKPATTNKRRQPGNVFWHE